MTMVSRMTVGCRLRTIVLVVSAAMGGLVWLLSPAEPVYHGRQLSSWLRDYDSAGEWHSKESKEIDQAIRGMGTNAIPFLFDNLGRTDSPSKLKYIAWMREHPALQIHTTTALEHRRQVFRALLVFMTNYPYPLLLSEVYARAP